MLPLPLLDTASNIHIDGLEKLGSSGFDAVAMMGELIGLTAVVLIFGTPIIIVLSILANRAKRQRMIHDLVLKLAEKGQPIPPELFMDPVVVRQKSDLRSGITLMAIGFGLMGFFYFVGVTEAMGIGFIPLMIGLGYFVAWKIEQGKKEP